MLEVSSSHVGLDWNVFSYKRFCSQKDEEMVSSVVCRGLWPRRIENDHLLPSRPRFSFSFFELPDREALWAFPKDRRVRNTKI